MLPFSRIFIFLLIITYILTRKKNAFFPSKKDKIKEKEIKGTEDQIDSYNQCSFFEMNKKNCLYHCYKNQIKSRFFNDPDFNHKRNCDCINANQYEEEEDEVNFISNRIRMKFSSDIEENKENESIFFERELPDNFIMSYKSRIDKDGTSRKFSLETEEGLEEIHESIDKCGKRISNKNYTKRNGTWNTRMDNFRKKSLFDDYEIKEIDNDEEEEEEFRFRTKMVMMAPSISNDDRFSSFRQGIKDYDSFSPKYENYEAENPHNLNIGVNFNFDLPEENSAKSLKNIDESFLSEKSIGNNAQHKEAVENMETFNLFSEKKRIFSSNENSDLSFINSKY